MKAVRVAKKLGDIVKNHRRVILMTPSFPVLYTYSYFFVALHHNDDLIMRKSLHNKELQHLHLYESGGFQRSLKSFLMGIFALTVFTKLALLTADPLTAQLLWHNRIKDG